jgi:hypothetical protein
VRRRVEVRQQQQLEQQQQKRFQAEQVFFTLDSSSNTINTTPTHTNLGDHMPVQDTVENITTAYV